MRALYNKWFRIMGGWGLVRFVDDRGQEWAEGLGLRAMAEAERIERKFSRYLDDSVISRINRNAGRTPVAVDVETIRLVERAIALARRTKGAFDPTVGVLRRVWDYRAGVVPSRSDVDALLPLVDYTSIAVSCGTVFLRRAGMELDLGGLGKEYAADLVADRLAKEGVESAIVNLGGDIRCVRARGDGKPWKVGVLDPRSPSSCRYAVRLPWDGGIASSGDYERCFIKDGVRYHHLLDARTGWPARGAAGVTAVGPTAFEAGLAATAAFLLGPDEGMEMLEQAAGVEGAIIGEDGELRQSSGMHRVSDLPGSFFARYPLA